MAASAQARDRTRAQSSNTSSGSAPSPAERRSRSTTTASGRRDALPQHVGLLGSEVRAGDTAVQLEQRAPRGEVEVEVALAPVVVERAPVVANTARSGAGGGSRREVGLQPPGCRARPGRSRCRTVSIAACRPRRLPAEVSAPSCAAPGHILRSHRPTGTRSMSSRLPPFSRGRWTVRSPSAASVARRSALGGNAVPARQFVLARLARRRSRRGRDPDHAGIGTPAR